MVIVVGTQNDYYPVQIVVLIVAKSVAADVDNYQSCGVVGFGYAAAAVVVVVAAVVVVVAAVVVDHVAEVSDGLAGYQNYYFHCNWWWSRWDA